MVPSELFLYPNGQGSSSTKAGSATTGLRLLDLPAETLDAILEYSALADLVNLSLVSHSCHDLAAAQLYRNLNHVFSDEDGRGGQFVVDRLAGMLETLVTNDYNYARFIKKISIDTAHTADKGERAIREYKLDYSCGKFLNTLLLATLKKVAALETFRWNCRVELSQAVFAALSKMTSLQHLHIRLQAGPSLYSSSASPAPNSMFQPIILPPPPAPAHHHGHHHPHHSPPSAPGFTFAPPSSAAVTVRLQKRLDVHRSATRPCSFSAFSGLRSLSILDMDTLEYLPEISQCISQSSSSLKALKLSFSDNLALKARKRIVVESSDTETGQGFDDMFDANDNMLPPPLPPVVVPSAPNFANSNPNNMNEADVKRERMAQEKALTRIFGIEKDKDASAQKKLEEAAEEAIAEADKEAQAVVMDSALGEQDTALLNTLEGILQHVESLKNRRSRSARALRTLDRIEKAAARYLNGNEDAEAFFKERKRFQDETRKPAHIPFHPNAMFGPKGAPKAPLKKGPYHPPPFDPYELDNYPGNQNPQMISFAPGPSKKIPLGSTIKYTAGPTPPKSAYNYPGPAYTSKPQQAIPSKKGKMGSKAKEIPYVPTIPPAPPSDAGDGFGPENTEVFPPAYQQSSKGKADDEFDSVVDMEHPELSDEGEDQEFIDTTESLGDDDSNSGVGVPITGRDVNGAVYNHSRPSSRSAKGKEPMRSSSPSTEKINGTDEQNSSDRAIIEYIRQCHGIPLESLSIHLIPVKPSVLCRAIDISALKHISLLNVGPQRTFWALLNKIHDAAPLQLTSIHTDNVTSSFLLFVNSLDRLDEIFMIERAKNSSVEPLTARTQIFIHEIRKFVLKKHIGNLQRLVIRNDDDGSWDLDRESVLLITTRGQKLKELFMSLASSEFHLFVRKIGNLRSLIALYIHFVHRDRCPSMLTEVRSCLIDNIIHCPDVVVEYAAVAFAAFGQVSPILSQLIRNPDAIGSVRNKRFSFAGRYDRPDSSLSSSSSVTWDAKGKANGKGKWSNIWGGPSGPSRTRQGSLSNDDSLWTPWDSDEDPLDMDDNHVQVFDGLRLCDAVGIKMWEKEFWDLRL